MLRSLGLVGIVGIVLILGGVALIALDSLQIAAGIGLVLAGLAIAVKALITNVLQGWGMV